MHLHPFHNNQYNHILCKLIQEQKLTILLEHPAGDPVIPFRRRFDKALAMMLTVDPAQGCIFYALKHHTTEYNYTTKIMCRESVIIHTMDQRYIIMDKIRTSNSTKVRIEFINNNQQSTRSESELCN